MLDALGSVSGNQVQQNPLQPDLQYRGFLASPLLGAPQGLSVYIDGVRLNEPFGDTLSWDLIPTEAIRSANLMPGSNPIYGLNTLGGALSLETKTGFSDPGAEVHLLGGSFGRRLLDVGIGGHGQRWGVFAAGRYFGEEGWRPFSPSRTASAFVATTYRNGATSAELALTAADTTLTGNGPAPRQLLALDRRAIFTHPDRTDNRMFMAVARGERPLAAFAHLSGVAYYRASRIATVNGDQADWIGCQDPAQAGSVCISDEAGAETPVLDDAGNPIPFDPRNPYNASENATRTRQQGYGVAAQIAVDAPVAGRENHLFVGAAANEGRAGFTSSSALARLSQNRGTVSSGIVDAESRVAVDSVTRDLGLYATDTFSLRRDLFVTAAARFNVSVLSLEDRLGVALTGRHTFHRLNPGAGRQLPAAAGRRRLRRLQRVDARADAAGADLRQRDRSVPAAERLHLRPAAGGGRRAHLRARRARAVEARARRRWTTSSPPSGPRTLDDILFISSGAVANRGYFANVGDTRRQGIEASLLGRRRFGAAARQRAARVGGALHLSRRALPDAVHGAVGGASRTRSPARSPCPRAPASRACRRTSARRRSPGSAAAASPSGWTRSATAASTTGATRRTCCARLPGFVVMNLRAAYQLARPLSVFLIVSNLFDASYGSFGVLGDASPVLARLHRSALHRPGRAARGVARRRRELLISAAVGARVGPGVVRRGGVAADRGGDAGGGIVAGAGEVAGEDPFDDQAGAVRVQRLAGGAVADERVVGDQDFELAAARQRQPLGRLRGDQRGGRRTRLGQPARREQRVGVVAAGDRARDG